MIGDTDITIERVYNLALLAKKMVSKSLPLVSAATVQSTKTCFYCEQERYVLKECDQNRRNQKTVPKIYRFRNSTVWIALQGGLKKTMPKRKATPHLVLLQQKEDSISS